MAVRGQAFETMMLVISVIVALAILGVLTGILGGLQIGVTSAPDQAMHDQLKQIVSSGYGYSVPQKVTLKKGTTLDLRSVVKNDLPEINPGVPSAADANVKFCVNTAPGAIPTTVLPGGVSCGASLVFGTGGSVVKLGPAVQDVSFYFVICGDSGVSNKGAYRIWIDGTSKGAGGCVVPTS